MTGPRLPQGPEGAARVAAVGATPLTIPAGLRRVRELLGLPARRVAALAGVDDEYLLRIEAGRAVPSLRCAEDVANALGVTLSVAAAYGDRDPRLDRLRWVFAVFLARARAQHAASPGDDRP